MPISDLLVIACYRLEAVQIILMVMYIYLKFERQCANLAWSERNLYFLLMPPKAFFFQSGDNTTVIILSSNSSFHLPIAVLKLSLT